MKLGSFLGLNGIPMAEFAVRVGATKATISRVVNGKVVPRRNLIEAIHRETCGIVTPNDLFGLFPASPERSSAEADGETRRMVRLRSGESEKLRCQYQKMEQGQE